MKSNVIENLNPDRGYNCQLFRNKLIVLESNEVITSYSMLVNIIKDNIVIKSAYICDVVRDEELAKSILDKVAAGRVDCETLRECIEELLM